MAKQRRADAGTQWMTTNRPRDLLALVEAFLVPQSVLLREQHLDGVLARCLRQVLSVCVAEISTGVAAGGPPGHPLLRLVQDWVELASPAETLRHGLRDTLGTPHGLPWSAHGALGHVLYEPASFRDFLAALVGCREGGQAECNQAHWLREVFGNPFNPVRRLCPVCRGQGRVLMERLPERRPTLWWLPDREWGPGGVPPYRRDTYWNDCPECVGGLPSWASLWRGSLPGLEPGVLRRPGLSARQMAGDLYREQAWRELPVLADLLEESGCADAGVLGHLRGGGPHCRGCWALELARGHPVPVALRSVPVRAISGGRP